MITLGYGDIVPVTIFEKIYVIFVTFISCGVFAYSVNTIGNIITEMTRKSTDFKQKMSLLSSHMRNRNLSHFL